MQHMYYDRDGKPIEMMEWATLLEQSRIDGTAHVADHYLRGWRVSTVWIGINMNFGWGDCPPLVFETMIFAPGDATDDERSRCDEWQARYGSERAALDGHWRAVDMVCKLLGYSRADLTEPVPVGDMIAAGLEELLRDA